MVVSNSSWSSHSPPKCWNYQTFIGQDDPVFGHVGSLILVGPSNHSFLTNSLTSSFLVPSSRRSFFRNFYSPERKQTCFGSERALPEPGKRTRSRIRLRFQPWASSLARKMVGVHDVGNLLLEWSGRTDCSLWTWVVSVARLVDFGFFFSLRRKLKFGANLAGLDRRVPQVTPVASCSTCYEEWMHADCCTILS